MTFTFEGPDLQSIFKQNFERTDLETAKRWYYSWRNDNDQNLVEGGDLIVYTQRAMAGHVSDYLEGKDGSEPDSYNNSNRNYLSSKYGPVLFWYSVLEQPAVVRPREG